MHEGGEALRNQPSQHLPDGNGAMASIHLPACKEGGTTEVWGDGGWGTTRRQQVEESGEGREEPVSPGLGRDSPLPRGGGLGGVQKVQGPNRWGMTALLS